MTANPNCKSREQAEQAVNEVWESCWPDTRPFDEVSLSPIVSRGAPADAGFALTIDRNGWPDRFTKNSCHCSCARLYVVLFTLARARIYRIWTSHRNSCLVRLIRSRDRSNRLREAVSMQQIGLE